MSIAVSVVIPYYYSGRSFLAEALASVRSQTATPAEIIVVDDGSSEVGQAHLSSLGEGVRVVRLERNRGPGVARNAGVEAAAQPYIAFLDSDDIWLPHKLETQYALMRAWPELDATYTGVVAFLADGSELAKVLCGRSLSAAVALSRHEMITPSIMIKRSSFLALGGFDPRFRCTQDWEMQIRMALAGFQTQAIDETLVRVRRQGHGNHSADWRCYLAGHLRILIKHRRAYVERIGTRSWIRLWARECANAGMRRGGWLGSVLRLPYRLGV